jgi:hypothetical protein
MGNFPSFVRYLAFGLLIPCATFAQSAQSRSFSVSVGATGATPGVFVDSQHHTLQVNVVSPATCSIRLEGSLDNVRWADLSGAQTCTSSTMFHVDGKPVVFVRANLTAYSGDQPGAKVAIVYKGAN